MFSKTKMILAAALILGSGVALANDRDGEEGGFVLSSSMDGVNPAYHRELSGATQPSKAGRAYDYVAPHGKAGQAFGSVAPHIKIVRPLPAHPVEDNYGPEAGKE